MESIISIHPPGNPLGKSTTTTEIYAPPKEECISSPEVESAITGFPGGRRPKEFEVFWESRDPYNPRLWPSWYKGFTIMVMSLAATIVALSSTLYTSGIPGLEKEFKVSKMVALLGVTCYLLGMAGGSIVVAPLSEVVGRRPVYLVTLAIFLILTIPSGLASNIEAVLVSRFFGGIFGSAMMVNSPASVNDIVSDEYRALAIGFWSIGPSNGPVLGPMIGGFVFQYLGWRWTNWIVLITGGVVMFLMILVKETYAPVILKQRAADKRKLTQDTRWWTRFDDGKELRSLLRTSLSRPILMILTEPICLFWDIYVSLVYAALYLCFVAYPIAFQQERGWRSGISGLSFAGIGVGVLTIIACEPLLRRLINLHPKEKETNKVAPEAMVSIICIGAILLAVGQFWFAWTCTPGFHWIVPILAGVPFGCGTACVFIYSSNYIAQSYGIYAASAMSGNMIMRSVLGACLPLAGPSMYRKLGLNWGGTLLGLLETACVLIPIVFYIHGHKIRKASTFINQLGSLAPAHP